MNTFTPSPDLPPRQRPLDIDEFIELRNQWKERQRPRWRETLRQNRGLIEVGVVLLFLAMCVAEGHRSTTTAWTQTKDEQEKRWGLIAVCINNKLIDGVNPGPHPVLWIKSAFFVGTDKEKHDIIAVIYRWAADPKDPHTMVIKNADTGRSVGTYDLLDGLSL